MKNAITNQILTTYTKHKVLIWLSILIFQQATLLLFMDGTGGDGDSVNHYLHNRYALKYPWLFVHPWSRPFFLAASTLFAQLGFIGMKLFNSLMAIGAAYLSYKIAKKIKISNPELAMPLLLFMPDYLRLSLSGLTEPLFSFMVVAAVLCLAYKRNTFGSLIISFLPFARPEGLFFIAIAAAYFLFKKRTWKYIPILLIGHVFYTLLGTLFFELRWDWIFTSNPNAVISPSYGVTGRLSYYIRKLPHIIGIPITILFWIGSVRSAVFEFWKKEILKEKLLLIFILSGIFSVIVAHSIFWKFGLFKSLGLTRNMLTIAPLIAIVSLAGMQYCWKLLRLKKGISQGASIITILIVCGFLYSGKKFTAKFPTDFQLTATQKMSQEVAQYIKTDHPTKTLLFHFYPYFNVHLDQDPFDWKHYRILSKDIIEKPIPENSIIIWDEWFSVMEGKVTLEMLHSHKKLQYVKSFETLDSSGRKRSMVLFAPKIEVE